MGTWDNIDILWIDVGFTLDFYGCMGFNLQGLDFDSYMDQNGIYSKWI